MACRWAAAATQPASRLADMAATAVQLQDQGGWPAGAKPALAVASLAELKPRCTHRRAGLSPGHLWSAGCGTRQEGPGSPISAGRAGGRVTEGRMG
jgi:hypothetical protein